MGFQIEDGVLVKYIEEPGVTEVVIPEGVTSIGNSAFEWCSTLTSIAIPNSVTTIGNSAFYECRSLKSITIPESVTRIGGSAFAHCSSLTNITIPEGVTSIGYSAFWGCGSLTSITIPESVTSIGDNAFIGCSSLLSINIPAEVTSISSGVFWFCSSLTSITIPVGVTDIGAMAFRECHSLMSIAIPAGVTSIGNGAFLNCSSLTSIVIPESVTSIGEQAFEGCKISEFTIPGRFMKNINELLPKSSHPAVLHTPDITNVSAKYRPCAAVAFAEDDRSIADENGKKYAKYIKANAAKLAGAACEHPALLYLMVREKLIAAKDLEAVTAAVQATGNAELIAAILDYSSTGVSEKAKAKAQEQKETREVHVTNFIFDTEKPDVLSGKTVVVTGKLKTFTSRDELKECLTAVGAALTETMAPGVDFLLTNTPNSGTAKNKKAEELGIQKLTEDELNKMIGRRLADA